MAKLNSVRQQVPSRGSETQSPSPHSPLPSSNLRWRSPSPKPGQRLSSGTPTYGQLGCSKDGHQHLRFPPSSPHSHHSSLLTDQSPPASLSQRCPSPYKATASPQSPHLSSSHPSFLHPKNVTTHNSNNNNNNNNIRTAVRTADIHDVGGCSVNGGVSNGPWSRASHNMTLTDCSTDATVNPHSHDSLWSGYYNRVARPFSTSEPSSRVQSPSPSPSPASFSRFCSPPPPHNYFSPMANKPPHPRSAKAAHGSTHNPLGLTIELPSASTSSSVSMWSPSCPSPRILSPPPIGVSPSMWSHNVAAPQPRNPRPASSSSIPFSSLHSATVEFSPHHPNSMVQRQSSGPHPTTPPNSTHLLRRSYSSNLMDRPPSPVRSNSTGLHCSWTESSCRSYGVSGRRSVDQQEPSPRSPRSGWRSSSSFTSCLSPGARVQSPLSPGRVTPGKSGGQHFTCEPWHDVQNLSNTCNGTEGPDTNTTFPIISSSPSPLSPVSQNFPCSLAPSDSQADWGDPEVEEGHCRSQIICAYIAQPLCQSDLSSSCLTLSSSDMMSSSPPSYQNYPFQVASTPHVQITFKTPPASSDRSSLTPNSPPLPFDNSPPSRPGSQKTSYATTVNLQIAGSGRITSLSTAQVSLTQTLQGGAGSRSSGQGQMVRRVSINGLSHLPSSLH